MNAYSSLARFYDSLTEDVPYEAFADFYREIFRLYGINVKTMLDLACGTGTLTHLLASRGYEMIGTDSSPEMLTAAMQKESAAQIPPMFICQPMEALDLYGTVNAAVCALDGVNYLEPGLLREAFRRVELFLDPGGVFIFDINTPRKLRNLDGSVFLDETDDVFCVWRAEFSEAENACFYGMDVFAKSGELWTRDSEEHIEYAHEPQALVRTLEETGFTEIKLFGELELRMPTEDEARIFIAARKKE
jgi:SAM-dependent methyltransferase